MKYILALSCILSLSSCYVYFNLISFEDSSITYKYHDDYKDTVTNLINHSLKLDKPDRILILPFLFINYTKKKRDYFISFIIESRNDSLMDINNFQIKIKNTFGDILISDTSNVTLWSQDTTNTIGHKYPTEYKGCENIKIENKIIGSQDTIYIDYSYQLKYLNGNLEKVERTNRKFIRKREKGFESVLK